VHFRTAAIEAMPDATGEDPEIDAALNSAEGEVALSGIKWRLQLFGSVFAIGERLGIGGGAKNVVNPCDINQNIYISFTEPCSNNRRRAGS
jgi:hypothetical protein